MSSSMLQEVEDGNERRARSSLADTSMGRLRKKPQQANSVQRQNNSGGLQQVGMREAN